MAFDLVIKGATIIDGRGGPGYRADVGVTGDTISAIGDLDGAAGRLIDASGLVLCPGFIDMHSHADGTILLYPEAGSALGQGITTSVGGNCGFSPAPLGRYWTWGFWEWNWWDQVAPAKYYSEPMAALETVRAVARERDGLIIDWSSFAGFLERVDAARPGINLVPLVGHSAVRTYAMGPDYRRHCTPAELEIMKDCVLRAMDEGAFGVSNGLDYAPNAYAGLEESVAVVKAAAQKGGLFASHWRRTGLREGFGAPGLASGLKEAVTIAQKAGARLQVAHLSPGYLVVPEATPRLAAVAAEETLAILDQAARDGVELAFDVIPNVSGGVMSLRYLCGMLAPWAREAGSPERLAENLRLPELRREIRQYIQAGKWYNLNPVTTPRWAHGLVILKSSCPGWEGKTVAQLAAVRGACELDTLFHVIQADPRCRAGLAPGSDTALKLFLQHPRAVVGIDTFVFDHTYEVTAPPYWLPHSNTYGGMARYLRLYGHSLLGLEAAIHRITGLAADILGLPDRGRIAVGARADLVVLDPAAVSEGTDPLEPRVMPRGYHWVIVNGEPAMEAGKLTGKRNGRVLRR